MQGISSKAAGVQESKKRFQGQEFAHNEFSDGSGLEMYEFKWRMDDPQTGRFWQVDPLSEDYEYNSPYAFSENKVTSHIELEGLEAVKFWDNPVHWAATFGEGYFKGEGDAYKLVDGFNRMLNPLVDVYHAVTGKDYETNQPVSRTDAIASLGITLIPGGKIEGAALKATERAIVKEEVKAIEKYEVGTAKDLSKASVKDGLDVHHTPQSKPASQVIKGYDKSTAPAIALPNAEHKAIPTLKGTNTAGSARDQLAKDIRDLRNYTNATNSSLQKLIDLNKKTYSNDFIKKQ